MRKLASIQRIGAAVAGFFMSVPLGILKRAHAKPTGSFPKAQLICAWVNGPGPTAGEATDD